MLKAGCAALSRPTGYGLNKPIIGAEISVEYTSPSRSLGIRKKLLYYFGDSAMQEIREDLKKLLLTGNSVHLKKYILDNYAADTSPDMFFYKVARDFLEIKHTEELAEETRRLVKATWFLAIGTTAAAIIGPDLLRLLKWCFSR